MSIASLADVRLLRTEAAAPADSTKPKTKAGIPVGVLNTLATWVPTETVATYVAVQAVMPAVTLKAGQKSYEGDYSDRWLLYAAMLALSVLLVPIYAKIKTNASSTDFKWPVLEILICAAAFTIWVMALQDSPFADFEWYGDWVTVAGIVGGGGLLGALTVMLKASPDWSETSSNNSPPSPDVT